MVTKKEIRDFSLLNPEYINIMGAAIAKEASHNNMDFSYILDKVERIKRFINDVSFDIGKHRAQSLEEVDALFRQYFTPSRNAPRDAYHIETCPHCNRLYSMKLHIEAEPDTPRPQEAQIFIDVCPHCYKPLPNRETEHAD
jgi:hypothetical protein